MTAFRPISKVACSWSCDKLICPQLSKWVCSSARGWTCQWFIFAMCCFMLFLILFLSFSVAYAYGEVTSQSLWPRIRSPFCGCSMAYVWTQGPKIYGVIYVTFNPLVYENVCVITSLPTKRISAISQWKTFLRVLPTRWWRKPAGIEITSLSPYVLK